MDSRDDITVQILRNIRDEIRGTNSRLDVLSSRIEKVDAERRDATLFQSRALLAMSTGLDDMGLELKAMRSDMQLAVEGLRNDMQGLRGDMQVAQTEQRGDRSELRERVERCEREIDDLKRRVS